MAWHLFGISNFNCLMDVLLSGRGEGMFAERTMVDGDDELEYASTAAFLWS